MKRCFLLVVCLVAAAFGAVAQPLVFPDSVRDVTGISEDDAPRTYTFRYRNISAAPVVIVRVEVTCGCTRPEWSRKPIPPGGEGEIRVTFHPRGRAGALDKSLFVYTSASASKPAARLLLTGTVRPTADAWSAYRFRMGPLRLKQVGVNFGSVPVPRPRVGRIEVANAGRRPLTLRVAGLPPYIRFRTEPEVIRPDSVADLVFSLATGQTDKRGTFEVEVLVEGLPEPLPPSRRAIRLRGTIEE